MRAIQGPADGLVLHGKVVDGAGEPVPDAVVEVWSAGSNRQRAAFSRAIVDASGEYTIRAAVPAEGYLTMAIFARGLLRHLTTRVYLDETRNDDVFQSVSEARRRTLIATREATSYRFDVHLQGPDETVFFEFA